MFIENITNHTVHDPESLPGRSGGGHMALIIFSEKHATFLLNLTPIIMEKKKVKISYACPIKWDAMESLDDKNKFCGSCKMKVQDFTKDSELNTASVHCGRFRMNQVESINRTFSFNPKQVFVVSLFSLLGMTTPLAAQNEPIKIPSKSITSVLKQDFTLSGKVKNLETNQPIEGVRVSVSNSTGRLFTTRSDSSGFFSIELIGYSVLDGDLKFWISKEGFVSTNLRASELPKDLSIAEISIIPNPKSEVIQILSVRGLMVHSVTIRYPYLDGKIYNEDLKTNYRQ
tara:strand:+ start:174 stop:1031 length:858 start_codon:yes stop_codon:yes gene_type:complete